jgi:hypothetical protein
MSSIRVRSRLSESFSSAMALPYNGGDGETSGMREKDFCINFF